jgi:hypothetical protein
VESVLQFALQNALYSDEQCCSTQERHSGASLPMCWAELQLEFGPDESFEEPQAPISDPETRKSSQVSEDFMSGSRQ